MKTLQVQMPVGVSTPSVLTKKEAAEYLRCTTRYIERAIKSGRLAACKPTGKLVRIRLKDLEAFLESGATTKEVV
jgi:excisionase family DNA binding protein